MSFARLKETFFRLPRHVKFIGAGSLALAISTVLPWYADLDSYRIGDQFLGVTGPAAFVGIVVLVLAGFSFWIFSYHLLERRVPRLPVREGILHLFTAIESLFLLVLVNSIYFHPKFGVNITLKESSFGMTIAFASAVVLLIGAYTKNKEEISKTDEIGKLEPLIKLEPSSVSVAPKAAESSSYQRIHAPLAAPAAPPKLVPRPAHAPARSFVFGEQKNRFQTTGAAQPQSTKQPSQASAPAALPASSPAPEKQKTQESGEGSRSYLLRMDL